MEAFCFVSTVPSSMGISPSIAKSRDVLPEPTWPITPTFWEALNWKLILRTMQSFSWGSSGSTMLLVESSWWSVVVVEIYHVVVTFLNSIVLSSSAGSACLLSPFFCFHWRGPVKTFSIL